MTIGVCIPSRALIHSRTMQDLLGATQGYDVSWYFSHGHNIPECHNIIVEEALKDDHDYIWLVEDDNSYPHDILKQLLEADVDVATADYPVRGSKHCATYLGGKFVYAGLGCNLVKPWVFEKLGEPYFRVDTRYAQVGDYLVATDSKMGNHGISDVDWWQRVLDTEATVKVIDKPIGHYYLKEPDLPKYGNDTGEMYKVEEWLFP